MKVRIGHLEYPIRLESEDNADWGATLGTFDTNTGIELHPEQSSSSMASTLIHEFLHGVFHVYGRPDGLDDTLEEVLCGHLEGPLLSLLRDNFTLLTAVVGAANGRVLRVPSQEA